MPRRRTTLPTIILVALIVAALVACGEATTSANLYSASGVTPTTAPGIGPAASAPPRGAPTTAAAARPSAAAAGAGGTAPRIGKAAILPADNIWNRPVGDLPAHANSAAYLNSIGIGAKLHPDFGSGLLDNAPIGIPVVVVSGTQPKVAIRYTEYGDESDPGPMPIPPDAPIEGGPDGDGDRHVLVIDQDNGILYELYRAFPKTDGSWEAESGAIWPLGSNALRTDGWTSADAAGLPVVPGLARYDEVAGGAIRHALRFTVPRTQRAALWPATHVASTTTDTNFPPMGLRLRLKASVDIGSYPPQARVVLQCLRDYGMILADNGGALFVSGAPDPRWDNDDLGALSGITAAMLEAVDESGVQVAPGSAQAKQPAGGQAPAVAPSAAPTTAAAAPTRPAAAPTATIAAGPTRAATAPPPSGGGTTPPTAPPATAPPSVGPTATSVSGAPPQPGGSVPSGWLTYRGPAEFPIVFAYPPGWTIDTGRITDQVIFVVPPSGTEDDEYIEIINGPEAFDANIDVLRDEFFTNRIGFCDKRGIEATERRQYASATFAILRAACDSGGTLLFLQIATGLKGGDEWDITMRTPYGSKDQRLREVFDPLLASINIYALITVR